MSVRLPCGGSVASASIVRECKLGATEERKEGKKEAVRPERQWVERTRDEKKREKINKDT